jgi:hypothetical protein
VDGLRILLFDENGWIVELSKDNFRRVRERWDRDRDLHEYLPFEVSKMTVGERLLSKLDRAAEAVTIPGRATLSVELIVKKVKASKPPPRDAFIRKPICTGEIIDIPAAKYRLDCRLWLLDADDARIVRRLSMSDAWIVLGPGVQRQQR